MLSGTDFEYCTYVLEVQINLLEMLEVFDKLEKFEADNRNAQVGAHPAYTTFCDTSTPSSDTVHRNTSALSSKWWVE